jgi:hypothetical protein
MLNELENYLLHTPIISTEFSQMEDSLEFNMIYN